MFFRKKVQHTKRPILKIFLIGSGIILIPIIVLVIWVYVSLFSGPDAMELSKYHPFRSQTAKMEYLQWYEERASHWPVESDTLTLNTTFGRTFVRISGPADAQPLILLPGGGATSLMWIPNIEDLSKEYKTYAVDNIYDFGLSVYTKEIKGPDDLVTWLDELLTALELEDNINLMGLSHGGWLTSQYALKFPERLNKIVLLAPAATVLPFNSAFLQRAVLTLLPHRYFFKNLMDWLLEDLVNKDEESKMLVETAVDDAMLARKCFKFKMMINPTILEDSDLQNFEVPTLFLVGENEKIYSADDAVQRINNIAPQIKTEIIPGCGHDITITQSEIVNMKILEFLKE